MVRFFFDVHVPRVVGLQLERRKIDVLTAQADGSATLTDHDLLLRVGALNRVMVTGDIRFRAMAERWQADGRAFAGLVFAHPLQVTIGQMVIHLELIALVLSPEEIRNQVIHLPL